MEITINSFRGQVGPVTDPTPEAEELGEKAQHMYSSVGNYMILRTIPYTT